MRRLMVPLLVVLGAAALAQQSGPGEITPTLRANTRLVMLDVIATDASGKPIPDLKAGDFEVEENGKEQKLASVELVNPRTPPAGVLPAGIYSNRPEFVAPAATYTILLIDAMNTPVQNQAWARQQLLRYAYTQLQPGNRVAVFALGNSLYKLQGFTDDPQLLKNAIEASEKVALSAAPPEQPGPASRGLSTVTRPQTGEAQFRQISERIEAFHGEASAFNVQVAISTTTAALRAISRMMLGLPGRKNLVWVSAGVPITLLADDMTVTTVLPERADATGPPPLNREMSYAAYAQNVRSAAASDVREAAALLQQAQVSVYPVDARGLFGGTAQTDATGSGLNSAGLLVMGHEFQRSVQSQGNYITNSQANMKAIAADTGGRYYINRNDIAEAVGAASRDGGTYYALAYYPSNKKFDNRFRRVKVSVNRPGVTLRHRHGYYAIDFSKGGKKEKEQELANTVGLSLLAPSTMVLFDARVVPPAAGPQVKVPVQFLVRSGNFSVEEKDGGKHVNLDFFVTAVKDGKIAATEGSKIDAVVSAEQFAQIEKQGILSPVEVALAPGKYDLILAVRDNPTGLIGTLNVPLELAAPAK